MTNKETAAIIRAYTGSFFSWPTDHCGYEQHIRFVEHRNSKWPEASERGKTFRQFMDEYAEDLEAGIYGPDPDEARFTKAELDELLEFANEAEQKALDAHDAYAQAVENVDKYGFRTKN